MFCHSLSTCLPQYLVSPCEFFIVPLSDITPPLYDLSLSPNLQLHCSHGDYSNEVLLRTTLSLPPSFSLSPPAKWPFTLSVFQTDSLLSRKSSFKLIAFKSVSCRGGDSLVWQWAPRTGLRTAGHSSMHDNDLKVINLHGNFLDNRELVWMTRQVKRMLFCSRFYSRWSDTIPGQIDFRRVAHFKMHNGFCKL